MSSSPLQPLSLLLAMKSLAQPITFHETLSAPILLSNIVNPFETHHYFLSNPLPSFEAHLTLFCSALARLGRIAFSSFCSVARRCNAKKAGAYLFSRSYNVWVRFSRHESSNHLKNLPSNNCSTFLQLYGLIPCHTLKKNNKTTTTATTKQQQ